MRPLLVCLVLLGGAAQAAPKKPVYLGARACAACHTGQATGGQCSRGLDRKHSQSYAVLARPEAREIARISGLRESPRQSPICLGCHATAAYAEQWEKDDTFRIEDGVQCEACHGPGSEYAEEKVMRDRQAAQKAGLVMPGERECMACHIERGSHTTVLPASQNLRYKTPLNLALRPGSGELYVACEAADSLIVVDLARRERVAEIAVGGNPADVTFTPDGRRAFVSNRLDDTVSVIDPAARRVVRTLRVGDEPHGLLTDRQGKLLYVLNSSSDDISVFDAGTLAWLKNLSAGRAPWSLAL
ncbi:MAG: multiheme c-type cytochrome, partial [Acidobacteriota bacterium]